jgi:DNA-binding transcriptional ArsR family regulator
MEPSMFSIAAFAETAALAGDPARANMLMALMDGRALTAAELARAAGVTPQTASGHLARLSQAGLIAVHRQGRHHYHRLASVAVARMVESIMEVSEGGDDGARRRAIVTGPRDAAMRRARTCYDHLAGNLAVQLADAMADKGLVELSPEGGTITEVGVGFFQDFGVDVTEAASKSRQGRLFCRPCLDWSERRLHIGGTFGAAFAARCFELNWVRRVDGARTVNVTRAGELGFHERFGI